MIKLMNGLIKIRLKNWINDIEICLLLCRIQASIRAGYSEKNARNTGSRMLTNANIIEALNIAMKKRT